MAPTPALLREGLSSLGNKLSSGLKFASNSTASGMGKAATGIKQQQNGFDSTASTIGKVSMPGIQTAAKMVLIQQHQLIGKASTGIQTAAKSGFDSTASTIGKAATGIQTAAKSGI